MGNQRDLPLFENNVIHEKESYEKREH